MKAIFKKLFSRPKNQTLNASEFFRSASRGEKERLLKDVIRQSNQDQRDLVRRYHEKFSGNASQ